MLQAGTRKMGRVSVTQQNSPQRFFGDMFNAGHAVKF
jgi:hypothetical protein